MDLFRRYLFRMDSSVGREILAAKNVYLQVMCMVSFEQENMVMPTGSFKITYSQFENCLQAI